MTDYQGLFDPYDGRFEPRGDQTKVTHHIDATEGHGNTAKVPTSFMSNGKIKPALAESLAMLGPGSNRIMVAGLQQNHGRGSNNMSGRVIRLASVRADGEPAITTSATKSFDMPAWRLFRRPTYVEQGKRTRRRCRANTSRDGGAAASARSPQLLDKRTGPVPNAGDQRPRLLFIGSPVIGLASPAVLLITFVMRQACRLQRCDTMKRRP